VSAKRQKENGLSIPLSGKDHGLENPCPLEEDSGEELGISEWRHKRVKDFGEIITGRTPSTARKDFYDGDYNLISPSDLDNGKYVRTAHKRLTKLGFDQCRALPKGTVLVGCIGNVGKLGLVGNDESATNQQINALICNAEYDPEFIYYCFHENRGKLEKRAVKTTVPILNKTNFGNFEINVPPLPEQKKIAHLLSTVQRAIEAQESIIQTTTELKKALMHKLFTEGVRGEKQKETEIGLVPESWEVVSLSDVCRFQSGGTPSKQNPEFWQGTIPWVSPKDMKRPRLADVTDHISQEALESGSKLAPAGSVFVVVRGMILAKTVPVALAEVPMAINQDMKAIVPGPRLRSDFLLYALETFRDNLFKKVGRSGHGTATLMGHEVAAFKIPLPDLQPQEEIASAIENIDLKKEHHEQKRAQLQDLFRTLLHELMMAKTRVHELEMPA
jgi:type I restriction enzyme S subunit